MRTQTMAVIDEAVRLMKTEVLRLALDRGLPLGVESVAEADRYVDDDLGTCADWLLRRRVEGRVTDKDLVVDLVLDARGLAIERADRWLRAGGHCKAIGVHTQRERRARAKQRLAAWGVI